MDQILKLKLHQSGEILPLDEHQAITAQELEDGATALRLYLEAAGTLRDHYIEVIKPNGSKMASARLSEQTDTDGAYVQIVLGGTLLDMPGRYAIQYCGYIAHEKAVKSRIAFISVKGSVNALEGVGFETLDIVQYLNSVMQDVAAEIVSRHLAFTGTNTHQGNETFKWFTVTNEMTGGRQETGHYSPARIGGQWILKDGPYYFGGADGEIATLSSNNYSEWYSPDGYYWGIDGPFGLDIAIIKRGLANTRDALFKLPDIDYPEPDDDYSGSTPVPYTLDYQERVNALVTSIQAILQAAIDTKAPANTTYTKTETDGFLAGKADLQGGKVPASQLPSFVDDVINIGGNTGDTTRGNWANIDSATVPVAAQSTFDSITTLSELNQLFGTSITASGQNVRLLCYVYTDVVQPYGTQALATTIYATVYPSGTVGVSTSATNKLTLESDKIYVCVSNNKTYRLASESTYANGSMATANNPFVEISPSIALGETASTAFAGNRGKALETHAGETDAALAAQSDRIGALEDAIIQPFELLGLGDGEYTFTTSSRLRQVAGGEYVIITA